jgi:2,4-dienoyl-CoA reductase (NADPH2)
MSRCLKQEFLNTIRFYENSLNQLGVRIELNSDLAAQELRTFDAVVVATGAKPYIPDVQGAELQTFLNYDEFFRGDIKVKDKVVIVGSGGIGCDIAHMLSDAADLYPPEFFFDKTNNVKNYEEYIQSLPRNRTITLTRRGKRIGERLGPTTRWALIQLLENRGVQMMTQISYDKITAEGLQIRTRIGKEVLLPANTIIFATGQVPDSTLYNLMAKEVENCYQIGSCRIASEANAQTAIWEGAEIARMI